MTMKRIFDGLYVDQLFQRNEHGQTIYYPFGMMGRGYLLPEEREDGVRRATRSLMLVSLAAGIGFPLIAMRFAEESNAYPASWLIAGGAFVALLAVIFFFQSRLAAGLAPATTPRPPAREWLRRGRQARAPWTHWACLVLGLVTLMLAAAGFALGAVDGGFAGIASGVFLLLVGGLLSWDGAMGLIEKSRAAQLG